MRDGGGRLEQHQAVVRLNAIHSTALQLVHQRVVIEFGVIPAKRKLEPVLAVERAVAGAGIATDRRQNRHDLPSKSNGRLL